MRETEIFFLFFPRKYICYTVCATCCTCWVCNYPEDCYISISVHGSLGAWPQSPRSPPGARNRIDRVVSRRGRWAAAPGQPPPPAGLLLTLGLELGHLAGTRQDRQGRGAGAAGLLLLPLVSHRSAAGLLLPAAGGRLALRREVRGGRRGEGGLRHRRSFFSFFFLVVLCQIMEVST